MAADREVRQRYEADVRALRNEAYRLLVLGFSIDVAARELVHLRNMLKRGYRLQTTPTLVALIEACNRQKYGNPLGPTADALHLRYST
ncbi:MAG: hypothetical protein RL490_2811 [Pseudomonadota bacterium]|jgi:hypothetical protein